MNSQDNINCIIFFLLDLHTLANSNPCACKWLSEMFLSFRVALCYQRKQDLCISCRLGVGNLWIILILLLKYEMATKVCT